MHTEVLASIQTHTQDEFWQHKPAYPQLSNGCPDTCKPNMLFPKEVGVYTALRVSNNQEGTTYITQLHLFMEVIGIHLKPSKCLRTETCRHSLLNRARQSNMHFPCRVKPVMLKSRSIKVMAFTLSHSASNGGALY